MRWKGWMITMMNLDKRKRPISWITTVNKISELLDYDLRPRRLAIQAKCTGFYRKLNRGGTMVMDRGNSTNWRVQREWNRARTGESFLGHSIRFSNVRYNVTNFRDSIRIPDTNFRDYIRIPDNSYCQQLRLLVAQISVSRAHKRSEPAPR